jgi:FkbM family methyltransferase
MQMMWLISSRHRTSTSHLVLATLLIVQALACSRVDEEQRKRDAILDEKQHFSYGKEELIARHFFNDMREGVFLDIGCFRWDEHNVTLYLEKTLGWSGIAIDAQPGLATDWRSNRSRSKFFQIAVSDTTGDSISFYLAGELSSVNEDHLDQFEKMAGKQFPAPQRITVRTITLDDLLEREGVHHIDFMSMDIEGAELQALAGFDIDRYQPKLIGIEAGSVNREKVIDYFDEHGYQRIDAYLEHDPINWYFKPLD